jgi:hypothetical protein
LSTPKRDIEGDYRRWKGVFLSRIRERIGPADAEDVLHECAIRMLGEPRATWRTVILEQCGQWIAKRRRIDLGFDSARISDMWRLAHHLEHRDAVRRATKRLTQAEVRALLEVADAGTGFAHRARVARRKAKKALPAAQWLTHSWDEAPKKPRVREFRIGQGRYVVSG